MKGLENQTYLIAYIISNIVAVLMLLSAWKWPRVARLLFFALFAWACWVNWNIALYSPEDYQDFADLAVLPLYKDFIQGWFHRHTTEVLGAIATCQGLIAMAMLLKGTVYKIGVIGGMVFLLAIMPLGVGAAFPCTLIMAVALYLLLPHHDYLWKIEKNGNGNLQWQ
jgi:hypothetical protein